ncbi:hypothetical protein [Streptomyces sp. NPDC094149]
MPSRFPLPPVGHSSKRSEARLASLSLLFAQKVIESAPTLT